MTSGMRTIRTFITYIAALLSIATAVLSCSKGVYDSMPDMEGVLPEKSILITGSVSDMEGKALEDITITFKAYPKDDVNAAPISTETAYSNSKGTFSILADGADMELLCIVTAEDQYGIYESQNQQIFVSWKGVSFDETANQYIVNDCSFILNRK